MAFELEVRPYLDIHYLSNVREPTEADLRAIIQSYPIVDQHCHGILRDYAAEGCADYPFESITSEAQGHALQEHVHSTLAHIRAIRALAELFDCPPSLQDVKAARYEWAIRDYDSLIKKCLAGTHALLIDDGLSQDDVYPVSWHGRHAPTVRRIARIEAVAAEQLEQLAIAAGLLAEGREDDWPIDTSEVFLQRFNTMFRNQIKQLATDPLVCGFKSVVCYRSGLDVSLSSRNAFRPHQSLAKTDLLIAFHAFLRQAVSQHNYRVSEKEVNDFLVVATCDVLTKLVETEGETLPIQFHTGLGDVDIDLVKSNPAYLQPLIEAFPNVDFVILHSSYPYTRDAGYLAANYANAWLDIGEVFPMLSRQGQESVVRQALELTPISKILWSTDGHFYPETFYLANKQFREALEAVLGNLVVTKDLTIMQAINAAVDILFWNSNALYKLDEERTYPQLLRACGRSAGGSQSTTLVHRGSDVSQVSTLHAGLESPTSTAAQTPNTRRTRMRTTSNQSLSHRTTPRQNPNSSAQPLPSTVASSRNLQAAMEEQSSSTGEDNSTLETFVRNKPGLKYVWLQFISNTGTVRTRMVPIKQFRKIVSTRKYVGITSALPRLLQNDGPAAGAVATGEFLLKPDLKSLCMNLSFTSPSATVQTWWMIETEGGSQTHWTRCPRWALQRQVDALSEEVGLSVLLGFEVEIIFMKPVMNKEGSDYQDFKVMHEVHDWSTMTTLQLDLLPMVEEMVEALAEVGISIEQFHAESAPTQWEFPLPPMPPVQAVDQLYKARDIISQIARSRGLKATVYPRPFAAAPGSASHAHFSLNGSSDTVKKHEDSFLAGVLEHLPSIIAYSLSVEESYARVAAGVWAGGEWITWGTQNREAPIRKCGNAHWEFKTIDGMCNAYLAMAALVAAGRDGVQRKLELKQKDTLVDASTLSEEKRKALGITKKLPNKLELSLDALRNDEELAEVFGHGLIEDYIAVKEAEMKMLDDMDEHRRKVWLISRY